MPLPKLNNKVKRNGSHSETVVPQRLLVRIFFVNEAQETLKPQWFQSFLLFPQLLFCQQPGRPTS